MEGSNIATDGNVAYITQKEFTNDHLDNKTGPFSKQIDENSTTRPYLFTEETKLHIGNYHFNSSFSSVGICIQIE